MRYCRNWLKSFSELGGFSEAPQAFHFWAGVFTIASVLRRRVYIDQRIFQWIPNFYVVFVSPPGIASKSTTLGLSQRLLSAAAPDLTFGPASVTWQALTDALAESPDSSICCIASELGTFVDPKDPKMFDVLVDLWDGSIRTWQHRTRHNQGTPIENPVINIAAGTTPAWLRNNLTTELLEGGFSSRTIYVWGSSKSRLVPYPALEVPDETFQRLLDHLTHDLAQIAQLEGQFTLTKEAIEWGSSWYRKHWETTPPSDIASYWARAQTHLHKLAMVISAADAEAPHLTITETHLRLAAHVLLEVERGIRKVHTIVGTSESGKRVHALVDHVRANPGISHKDVAAAFAHQMTTQELAEAIRAAQSAGFIELKRESGGFTLWPLDPPSE